MKPDNVAAFDAKQKEFRENLAELTRQRKEKERQLNAQSQSAADKSEASASAKTPDFSATSTFLGNEHSNIFGVGVVDATRESDTQTKKKSKGISSFVSISLQCF